MSLAAVTIVQKNAKMGTICIGTFQIMNALGGHIHLILNGAYTRLLISNHDKYIVLD
jgi:hypothetical protein